MEERGHHQNKTHKTRSSSRHDRAFGVILRSLTSQQLVYLFSIPISTSTSTCSPFSILIENLICILQNCINHLDLPARIGNSRTRIGSHESRTEYDGQVMRVHPVDVGVVHDAIEMERHGTEGGVVGVGEGIDDGVQGVAADNVVVVFCFYEEESFSKSSARWMEEGR